MIERTVKPATQAKKNSSQILSILAALKWTTTQDMTHQQLWVGMIKSFIFYKLGMTKARMKENIFP